MKWNTKGGAVYPLEAARRGQEPLVRCGVNLGHLRQQLSSPISSFLCHSLICANLDLPRSCGCLQEVEIEGDGVAALAQRDIPSYIYSPSYVPKVPDVNVKTDTETYLEDGDHYMCWPVLYPQITGGDRLPGEIFVFHF